MVRSESRPWAEIRERQLGLALPTSMRSATKGRFPPFVQKSGYYLAPKLLLTGLQANYGPSVSDGKTSSGVGVSFRSAINPSISSAPSSTAAFSASVSVIS